MKKKILFYALIIGFLSICSVVFSGNNTYASCQDAGGHLSISSDIISLGEVGGSDYGIDWACGRYNTNSAILFFARSVDISGGYYHINADIELTSDEWTPAELYGMVHFHGGGKSTQYASHIGFCRNEGDCAGTGAKGAASVNSAADGATADGLIWFDFSVLQRAGEDNPHGSGVEYWALPYYHKTIWINNAVLKDAIKNHTVEMSDSLYYGGTSGWVKIYIHKCYSTNSNGSVSGNSTCEEGSSYISVKNVITENPTTFDNRVTAAVGSCTSDCWIDSASTTATFTHQVKRNNDGPDSAISNSWWAYYDKSKNSINAYTPSSTSGTQSFAKNSGWKTVHTHNVSVSLNPGASTTKCEANWIYTKVSDSGTIDTSNYSVKDACIKISRYELYTFTGSVTATAPGLTKAADGKYYIDGDKANVQFVHNVKRTDGTNKNVTTNWRVPSASASGSVTLGKSPANSNVYTNGPMQKSLSVGDNVFCDTLYYNSTVHYNGALGAEASATGCVTIHRYAWYTVDGKVDVETDATNDNGTFYTDANIANIQFIDSLKRNTTVGIQTQYYTENGTGLGTGFNAQTSWANSTINVNNQWYQQYKSPSNGKGAVNVAKDTGTTYCQTLYWYGNVREDSADRNTKKSASKCIALKRYLTTFTGQTKIFINSTAIKDANGNSISSTTNLAGKKIYVYGNSYPVVLPTTFSHIVTRSSSDAHGSPTGKSPEVVTTITAHNDVRNGDPYGTAKNTTVGPLAAGGSGTVNDTFNLKVYPENSMKLCQQMNYTSEIQGTEHTKHANAAEACVEIVMAQAECFGQKYGIKNGKNYIQTQIFKNTVSAANRDSTLVTSGNHRLTAWAKPGDQIRFDYAGCAGGELARQYQGGSGSTSYKVRADINGNLFGNTLSSSPNYNEIEKTLTNSNLAVGTGPFTGGSFTFNITSPSGSGIYSCSFYGTNNISNFYRIPAYIQGVMPDNYRSNCKSDDYGRQSDLGETITQTATWSDIQYANSTRTVNGTGTITAEVKVPYNYLTDVETSGTGGYLLPGTDHTENVKLTVVKRINEPVNGSTEYATTTKPSKYRLIEIIIGTDHTGSAGDFNNLVNGDEYFKDSNGSKDLSKDLDVCKKFNCDIRASEDNKQYSPDNNGINGQTIGTYTREIPYNIDPGVKYCYIAAVWPSDSHLPTISNITESDNLNYGMVKSGIEGFAWHVSGATCFTVAKRPSFAVINGDTYAQRYISARVSKYPTDGDRNKMRIYGSWTEYGAIAGMSIKGLATGATLWGGSNIVANSPDKNLNCIYSSLTFSNNGCASGNLGTLAIDTTASSNPKNLTEQLRTRFTRSNAETERPVILTAGATTTALANSGTCEWNGDGYSRNPTDGRFDCIGDTGVKYVHAENTGATTVSIQSQFCLSKGNPDNNHTTVFHSNGTLVIGANVLYGSGSGCAPETYTSIAEVPQYIFAAKKIVIKEDVTHIDGWLIADEIITCDPADDWEGSVSVNEINTKNCTKQLTVNGTVMTKSLKLYRTHGAGFEGGSTIKLASPAEVFTMGPESYFWSFSQAQRFSQATTTYARELAPRY